MYLFIFFFNDTATTEIYTLSLHDALPICGRRRWEGGARVEGLWSGAGDGGAAPAPPRRTAPPVRASFGLLQLRSEEHTSELQSRQYLVCRLLLEKKKNINNVLTQYCLIFN